MKNTQNGLSIIHPRLYRIWYLMNYRCYNPKCHAYNRYGGVGIYVCDEWKNNFKLFLNWALENGYTEKLTLDRIDSSKSYTPNNCRWTDYYIQEQNKRVTKRSTTGHKGVYTDTKHNCYKVEITRNGKRNFLGRFKDFNEAVKVAEKFYSLNNN